MSKRNRMIVSLWSSDLVIGFHHFCWNSGYGVLNPLMPESVTKIVIKQPGLLHKQHEWFDVGQMTGTRPSAISLFDHRISQQHQNPRSGGGGNFCQALPTNIPLIWTTAGAQRRRSPSSYSP